MKKTIAILASIPEHLLTGIPRIDREHQTLAELIGWVDGVCSIANATHCHGCILSVQDTCGSNLETLLATLRAYMQGHFRYEERLMVDWPIPKDHVDGHQGAHRLIEKRLLDLADAFSRDRNTASTSRKVAGELRTWLMDHLEAFDSELAVYVGPEDHAT